MAIRINLLRVRYIERFTAGPLNNYSDGDIGKNDA